MGPGIVLIYDESFWKPSIVHIAGFLPILK